MKKLSLLFIFLSQISAFNSLAQNTLPMKENYATQWAEIDSLESAGLPKSAKEKFDILYSNVLGPTGLQGLKTNINTDQVIKCIIYKIKYIQELEESGFAPAVNALRKDMEIAQYPIRPILQSMLAEIYEEYLANNYWKFQNRSAIKDFKSDDILTWDVERLNTEAMTLFLASVADDKTRELPIENLNAITNFESIKETKFLSDKFRPTVYDFLLHRTIDYLNNDRSFLSKPAYKFEIDSELAFADADKFIAHRFTTKDASSMDWHVVRLFQKGLEIHKSDGIPDAMIDIDLKRLDFMLSKAVIADKSRLFKEALESMLKKHSTAKGSIPISYRLAQLYINKAAEYKPNPDGVGKGDYLKAKSILDEALAKFPDAYKSDNCRELLKQITQKSFDLKAEEVNVPEKSILARLEYRNVETIHLKIMRVSSKNGEVNEPVFENEIARLAYYNSLPIIKKWSVSPPNDGDFHPHSVELKIPSLALGTYLVLTSDNELFKSTEGGKVSYLELKISNLGFWHRPTESGVNEIVVTDRTTGTPLKNVAAEFWSTIYNPQKQINEVKKIGNGVSDERGFIYPRVAPNSYFTIRLKHGLDVLNAKEGFSNYHYQQNKVKTTNTHFFLDRGIYRPGQTVYFKGIVIETDTAGFPHIVTGKKQTITLLDVNSQKVSSLDLITNEFGTFNGSFTAPSSGLTGQMHLQGESGYQYFRVEEYKRPKFEVIIKPLTGAYQIGDTVNVMGQAKSYAGSNVDGASVKYRVVREVRFPYWYWKGYNPYSNRDDQEIAHGTTTSDAKGEFIIPFTAIPDKSIPKSQKPEFSYTIYTDVVDITGETHSARTNVTVGYNPYRIDLIVPERINRKKINSKGSKSEDAEGIQLVTTNLNGQFERLSGKIHIDMLSSPKRTFVKRLWDAPDTFLMTKNEFTKDFPNYAYRNEDEVEHWTKKRIAYKGSWDSGKKKSIEIDSMRRWQPGNYRITISTDDLNGEPISVVKYFTLYDLEDKLIPVNEVSFSVLEQKVFQPGDQVNFYIGTAEDNLKVLMELEKDGKMVTSQWMTIDGLQKIDFQIEESDRGNIHYHTSYVRNGRSYHDVRTLEVPYSNKELKIEYATFRDKLQPGLDEEWIIKVSGKDKEKVAAEMVAGMYDASLDKFAANNWSLGLYGTTYPRLNFKYGGPYGFISDSPIYNYDATENGGFIENTYRNLDWFGFDLAGQSINGRVMRNRAYSDSSIEGAMSPASTVAPVPVAI
jgi:hypothetical protein